MLHAKHVLGSSTPALTPFLQRGSSCPVCDEVILQEPQRIPRGQHTSYTVAIHSLHSSWLLRLLQNHKGEVLEGKKGGGVEDGEEGDEEGPEMKPLDLGVQAETGPQASPGGFL